MIELDMISFVIGIGITLFIIIMIGYFDVYICNEPKLKIKSNPVLAYVMISTWELMFAFGGFLIGVFFT